MIEYILFVVGFIFLIKGADLLVDGSSSIARRLGVAPIVIGLTLVAFGTSLPELVINIFSAPTSNDIPIGNILGSNIANVLLILGLAAILSPIEIPKNTIWKEIPFSLIAVIVLAVMSNDLLLAGFPSILGRGDGIILIIFFLIFLYYVHGLIKTRGYRPETVQDLKLPKKELFVIRGAKIITKKLLSITKLQRGIQPLEKQIQIKKYSVSISLIMVLFGLAGLILGGRWVVDGAILIARNFGLSEALISLSIIAIGTSLPELATSIVSVRKKRFEIVVGNIVGSSIFNIFFILGISSIIRPLAFSSGLNFDILVVVTSTLLFFGFMFVGRKRTLDRWQGLAFLLFYAAYILFIFYRG